MNSTNFSNKINTAIHGEYFDPKTQITAEDIAKCKGSSHSIMSRIYHQIKTRWKKGEFVRDKMIDSILHDNEGAKLGGIKKAVADTLISEGHSVKQVSKERKLAAEIAKIFADRADDSKVSNKHVTGDFRSEVRNAHDILNTLREVERYDPEELLRAAAYEFETSGKKGPIFADKATSGIKGDFVTFMVTEYPEGPTNKEELKTAYKEFIKEKIIQSKGQKQSVIDEQKAKLESYRKDNSVNGYRAAQSNHESGWTDLVVEKYTTMPLTQLLKIFNPAEAKDSNESHFESTKSFRSSDFESEKTQSTDTEKLEPKKFGHNPNTSSES